MARDGFPVEVTSKIHLFKGTEEMIEEEHVHAAAVEAKSDHRM
jgi:hypothetical protein